MTKLKKKKPSYFLCFAFESIANNIQGAQVLRVVAQHTASPRCLLQYVYFRTLLQQELFLFLFFI